LLFAVSSRMDEEHFDRGTGVILRSVLGNGAGYKETTGKHGRQQP
jgi:hypothetical protein